MVGIKYVVWNREIFFSSIYTIDNWLTLTLHVLVLLPVRYVTWFAERILWKTWCIIEMYFIDFVSMVIYVLLINLLSLKCFLFIIYTDDFGVHTKYKIQNIGNIINNSTFFLYLHSSLFSCLGAVSEALGCSKGFAADSVIPPWVRVFAMLTGKAWELRWPIRKKYNIYI